MGDEKVPQKRSLTVETFICEKYSSTFQQLGWKLLLKSPAS